MDTKKFTNKIKETWNNNPLGVVGAGAAAITAVAQIVNAKTNRSKAKSWKKEVNRRVKQSR